MKKSRSSLLVVWNGSLLPQHPIRTFSLEGTCKDLQSMSTSWIQPCASPRFCIQLLLLVMTGQGIEIKNDDATNHNIHPLPKINQEWNESQPPKGDPKVKSFARE